MIATITPMEALRRLIAEVKQLDAVEVGARWNQLQGELGVAEGVAREPVYEEELARVRLDVEEGLGYGFMVDGRRVGMNRIVWYNRPGETALHARGLPCPDEDKILDEFNTWFGPVVADSNAHNSAIQFWAQEAYRAGRLGLAYDHSGEKQEPVAYLRFWAAQNHGGSQNNDIDYAEGLEVCEKGDIGADKLPAFPVYAAPVAAVSAAPSGEVERDAARYRWLRNCDWFSSDLCVLRNPKKALTSSAGLGADCPSRDRLDDFIDAAITATKEPK